MSECYRTNLISKAEKYCSLTGISRSTLGVKVANDGQFFDRIEKGASLTVDKHNHVLAWFDENMPKTTN